MKMVLGFVIGVLAYASSAAAQTPYTGTPAAIPGTVQTERFDNGGEGVAYHDTTSGNAGGKFRTNVNVDIGATSDTGSGGYLVGWTKAGEWLKYTVAVAATATYTVEFRVAHSSSGGTFRLEVDGVNVTGAMTVPNSGGGQAWRTISKSGIQLTAGTRVLRLVFERNAANGTVGNHGYLRFVQQTTTPTTPTVSTPFTGTPAPLPGTVQAEDFDNGGEGVAYHDTTSTNSGGKYRSSRVDISATTDAGGGYKVGWWKAGEWLNYTAAVPTTGTYDLAFRVANPQAGGRFHLEVDGVNVTGSLAVPSTGRFETFATVQLLGVGLSAGTRVLRVVGDTNASNGWVADFNWFSVTAAGVAPPPTCSYAIAPAGVTVIASGGTTTVTVTTPAGCAWTASSSLQWIAVQPSAGSGTGSVSVTVAANTMTSTRSGAITIGGQTFTVTQNGAVSTALCDQAIVASDTVSVNTPMHMLVCSKDIPSGFKTKISGGGLPDRIVDVGAQTPVGPANSVGALPYELPITFPSLGTFQVSTIAYSTDASGGMASTPSTNAITVTVQ